MLGWLDGSARSLADSMAAASSLLTPSDDDDDDGDTTPPSALSTRGDGARSAVSDAALPAGTPCPLAVTPAAAANAPPQPSDSGWTTAPAARRTHGGGGGRSASRAPGRCAAGRSSSGGGGGNASPLSIAADSPATVTSPTGALTSLDADLRACFGIVGGGSFGDDDDKEDEEVVGAAYDWAGGAGGGRRPDGGTSTGVLACSTGDWFTTASRGDCAGDITLTGVWAGLAWARESTSMIVATADGVMAGDGGTSTGARGACGTGGGDWPGDITRPAGALLGAMESMAAGGGGGGAAMSESWSVSDGGGGGTTQARYGASDALTASSGGGVALAAAASVRSSAAAAVGALRWSWWHDANIESTMSS